MQLSVLAWFSKAWRKNLCRLNCVIVNSHFARTISNKWMATLKCTCGYDMKHTVTRKTNTTWYKIRKDIKTQSRKWLRNFAVTNRHFTVRFLVTWPMNAREAAGDRTLIQTSLLFLFKCKLVSIRTTWFTQQRSEICIKTRSPSASLSFKDQVTEQTTVQWSVSHSEILLPNVQFRNFSFPRISGFQTFGKIVLQFKRNFFRTMSEIPRNPFTLLLHSTVCTEKFNHTDRVVNL